MELVRPKGQGIVSRHEDTEYEKNPENQTVKTQFTEQLSQI